MSLAMRSCQEYNFSANTEADFFPLVWPDLVPPQSNKHDTVQINDEARNLIMPAENCPEKAKLSFSNKPAINLAFRVKYKTFSEIFATTQKGELQTYVKWPFGSQPVAIPIENLPQSVKDRFQKEKDFWQAKYSLEAQPLVSK
jgi:hypothetical protein